jgi:hypothetical protein
VIRKARYLARRSVAVMGSCEIGYFACGRGAVDLGEPAQLRPFLSAYTHVPAAKPAAGLSDDQTAGFFLWEGNPYDDHVARQAAA